MFTYREATSRDLRSICVLGQEVNSLHHAAWPDVFAPSGDPARDEGLWCGVIGRDNATTFVAEAAGEVIAFANISLIERDPNPLLQPISFARVGSVGVAEAHRGQGIGTELMRRLEVWAAARGARHITLHVWAFNQRAVELYRELGYDIRSYSMGKRLGVDAGACRPGAALAGDPRADQVADIDVRAGLPGFVVGYNCIYLQYTPDGRPWTTLSGREQDPVNGTGRPG